MNREPTWQKMILLTGGMLDQPGAKTAVNLIRYRSSEVVAVLDPQHAGKCCEEVLGHGGSIPVVESLEQAPEGEAVVVGIAPPGGKLPEAMRAVLREALQRGMTIVSGLHDLLSEDPELRGLADRHGAVIVDLRAHNEREVMRREGWNERCLRVMTVGHDCGVGKMVVSLELARSLQARGYDAKFVATGQTGILLEGDGCPVDAVVADFLNGAVERLVQRHQHHAMLILEGQGSLVHPRYSPVTLGLLHGAMPDALILCYEVGRKRVQGMESVRLPGLSRLIELYEMMAGVMHPAKVIGVAMNSRALGRDQAREEQERVRETLCLPVCDVVRDGPDTLVETVVKYARTVGKGGG